MIDAKIEVRPTIDAGARDVDVTFRVRVAADTIRPREPRDARSLVRWLGALLDLEDACAAASAWATARGDVVSNAAPAPGAGPPPFRVPSDERSERLDRYLDAMLRVKEARARRSWHS